MKSKEPSEQLLQFTERLKSKLPTGTGRAFAAKAGIGYSTLHNYLSAVSSPTLENLVLLAKALDVSIEWLATGKEASVSEVVTNGDKEPTRAIKIPFLDSKEFLLLDVVLLQDHEDIDHLVALRVTIDVMEPTFGAGAVIIVDTSINQLKENQLVVLKRGDNYLFKRVQVVTQGYNLLSDNKKYPILTVIENEFSAFDILGEVCYIFNKI